MIIICKGGECDVCDNARRMLEERDETWKGGRRVEQGEDKDARGCPVCASLPSD